MRKFQWVLWLCFPAFLCGQGRLEVEALGVRSSEGFIRVALFDSEDGFLKFDAVFMNGNAPAKEGTTRVRIDNIPPGSYALAIFHDLNGDEQLNTNWLGIPKEPLGFSRARMRTFGPPAFRDCLVRLEPGETVVQIPLE